MEFAIPALALGGLYVMSKKKENYENPGQRLRDELLPNVDVPNRNYPQEYPVQDSERDLTSKLSTVNTIDHHTVYSDKYFDANMNGPVFAGMHADSQYRSMTGQQVDLDYFRHNNMAPFFGSKVHTNNAPNATESTLDNYVGSGSHYITKKEQSPMFSPGDNYQWANGMPSTTDFVQSRVNPSRSMANVKPFEEIRVAPGLGLGYTSDGMGGYNSGMLVRDQWHDKTVDELRVANKQKASGLGMLGYEGPAYSHVQTMGSIGTVEKNRVERTFEVVGADHSTDRLFTTTGMEKAPTMRAIPVERHVNRPETAQSYTGVAGVHGTKQGVRGEYMPSHNQELGALPLTAAYAAGMGGARDNDYGSQSNTVYMNNRSANYSVPARAEGDGYFGAVKGVFGAAMAPLMDILRPSRKENAVGTLRPYQNAKAPVTSSYVYNPHDTLPVTQRQTMEVSKMHWNVDAHQRGGGYEMTDHQVVANQRDTTTDYYYAGIAGGGDGSRQTRSREAEHNQRNNDIKSSTIDGRMTHGNMSLLNGDINMSQRARELTNSRPVDGKFATSTPSVDHFGALQGTNQLYQTTQLDRNNGDILTQLKGNPYTLNHVSGL